jgi:hypothetical protein
MAIVIPQLLAAIGVSVISGRDACFEGKKDFSGKKLPMRDARAERPQ